MAAPSPSTITAGLRFFETLTDASVEDIRSLASPQMRYRDPFADAKGIDAVVAYMHKWFAGMDGLRFEFVDHAQTGHVLLSHWRMHFRIRKMPRKQWTLEGMSRTTFNEDGKVIDQVDYWDSAPLLEAFPLLGRVVALIRKIMV